MSSCVKRNKYWITVSKERTKKRTKTDPTARTFFCRAKSMKQNITVQHNIQVSTDLTITETTQCSCGSPIFPNMSIMIGGSLISCVRLNQCSGCIRESQ